MRRTTHGWILGLLLGASSGAAAQEVSPDTSARFAKSIQKLGSDDYQEREAASAEIAALPSEAIRLVEAALKKVDLELEVRTRLERAVPLLQVKARRETLIRKQASLQAWTRKTVLEAYEKVGRKDARWDAKAREALALISAIWSYMRSEEANPQQQAYALAQEAIQAGCDDPLILYVRERMYDAVVRKDFQEDTRLHLAAAQAMKERGAEYPPIRQAFVFARAGEFLSRSKKEISDTDHKDIQEWQNLSLARMADAARDATVPDSSLLECGEALTFTWKTLTQDRKTGFDKVASALSQARPDSPLPLVLKGKVYTDYAWDARGGGWANTVTDEGWKLMRERLAEAEVALTRAWEKDPADAQAPTLMIGVELGQGKGRGTMERWYKRAMEANPDNLEACNKKMYYLEPKWHGSAEAMVAFGRELLVGGNWEARLPFQLINAHLTLAAYEKKDQAAYYKTNPEVWRDVQAVYGACLARRDSAFDRTWFAKLACWCGQYVEAHKQFQTLGDEADVSVFMDRPEMDTLKAEAATKGH